MPERGPGDPTKDGLVSNSCNGNGYVRPSADAYRFSVENVREFACFLHSAVGLKSGESATLRSKCSSVASLRGAPLLRYSQCP